MSVRIGLFQRFLLLMSLPILIGGTLLYGTATEARTRLYFAGMEQEIAVLDRPAGKPLEWEIVWSEWSSWMQKHYPHWWKYAHQTFLRPWFNIRTVNGKPRIFLNRTMPDMPLTPRNLFRAFLLAHQKNVSPWWLETTTEALFYLFDHSRNLSGIRSLSIPFGQDPALAPFDALLLAWIERATPGEWIARIWMDDHPFGLHDLTPFLNLPDQEKNFTEWLNGFFLHWAMQSPAQPLSNHGTLVVRPFAAGTIDLAAPEEAGHALKVNLFFDRNIETDLWIIAFHTNRPPDLFRYPIRGNRVTVILGDSPRSGAETYRLVLVHPGPHGYETAMQIRWTTEQRRDLPFVLLHAGIMRNGQGFQIEWETAVEYQTHRWWLERWDQHHHTWVAIHAVGIPAARETYFPLRYTWIDPSPGTNSPRYRLRLELATGQILTVTELAPVPDTHP